MKRQLTRKQTAPPNRAAKALSLGQYQPKIEKNPKVYSRKLKHTKGSRTDGPLPFSVLEEEQAAAAKES